MHVDRFWYANQTATVPAVWHYISGIVSLLCLILGIVFNGLVIFVFIRNDVLKRPRNYYLINLAVTDLGLLLTNNTMHVISSFKKQWIFGQIGCNFYSVCGGVFGLTSIATMASIALNRLSAVNDPFSSLKLTSRSALYSLACTWVYGSVWIVPPLFGWNRFILEGFGTSCTFDYISNELWDRSFILLLVTGGFFIPLVTISLAYCSIVMKLSERSRSLILRNDDENSLNQRQGNRTSSFNQSNITHEIRSRRLTSTTNDSTDENNVTRNMRRTEARATRTALLICTVFCLAWGPYALMTLISLSGFNYLVNAYTTSGLGILTKVAACINPLIYAISLNGFREQIYSYAKCVYQCGDKHSRPSKLSSFDLKRSNLPNVPDTSSHQQEQSIPLNSNSV